MRKVKIKQLLLYLFSHDASVLHDLCVCVTMISVECFHSTIETIDYQY